MDGTNDLDGDTMINRHEYLAGTDPQDPQSYLKVAQIDSDTGTTLRFTAVSNRTYSVQYKNSLNDPDWSKLIDVGSQTTNRIEVIVDSDPRAGRYYRLVTPQQQ
jgi:hypothetical protein